MPKRPLNLSVIGNPTIAMYDHLIDGEWHPAADVIAVAATALTTEDYDRCLTRGQKIREATIARGNVIAEADLVASGAKDIARNLLMIAGRSGRVENGPDRTHRLTEATIAEWAALRPHLTAPTLTAVQDTTVFCATPAPATKKTRQTRPENIFGGITESDGFAAAPLNSFDRVVFRPEFQELPLADFRADLPAGCTASVAPGDGLYRVDCPLGTGEFVRDHIRDWCTERGIEIRNARPEANTRRRSPRDLDPDFLRDLCVFYARYSLGKLRPHMTVLQFHIDNSDDLQQQVQEWILDAICRYDAETGVPFGAFLSGRLTKWVHDINRNKVGRQAADAQLKQNRAVNAFVQVHGRRPTEHELADALGQPLHTVRKNAQTVATLNGLKNMQTLDVSDTETEIPIPDAHQADDAILDETAQSLMSQLLTNACTPDPDAKGKAAEYPNVLGWVTWYQTLWGGMTRTDLSKVLNTSMRNMSVYSDRVEVRMQAHREELLAG